MVPAVSDGASPTPPYSGYHLSANLFPYGTFTLYGPVSHPAQVLVCFNYVVLQPPASLNWQDLGYCAFARHYLRNHYCFLFLQVLRCFSSLGSLPDCSGSPAFSGRGCPIRTSADQFVLADPRGFSQLITSFFASESQGLLHTPFLTSIHPNFRRDAYVLAFSLLYSFTQHVKELHARIPPVFRFETALSPHIPVHAMR